MSSGLSSSPHREFLSTHGDVGSLLYSSLSLEAGALFHTARFQSDLLRSVCSAAIPDHVSMQRESARSCWFSDSSMGLSVCLEICYLYRGATLTRELTAKRFEAMLLQESLSHNMRPTRLQALRALLRTDS